MTKKIEVAKLAVNPGDVVAHFLTAQAGAATFGKGYMDYLRTLSACEPLTQDSTYKPFREALEAGLIAKGLTKETARTTSSSTGKVILFITNGFKFESDDITKAYREELKDISVPYWTGRAKSTPGANTKPKAAVPSSLVVDPAKLQILKEQARSEVDQETRQLAVAEAKLAVAESPVDALPLMSTAAKFTLLTALLADLHLTLSTASQKKLKTA